MWSWKCLFKCAFAITFLLWAKNNLRYNSNSIAKQLFALLCNGCRNEYAKIQLAFRLDVETGLIQSYWKSNSNHFICDWTLLFCSCYNFPRNKTPLDFHFNKTEVPINQAQWAGLCGAECFWGSDEIGRFSHEDINMEITIAKVILTLAKKDISQLISLYCWERWNGIYWSYKTWKYTQNL